MAKIAVIGFGSLVWDPRELKLADGEWHKDGPKLPVEFARVSQDGRLTLVIAPELKPQPTRWAYSGCRTLGEAKADLAKREGPTPEKNIGALKKGEKGSDATEQAIASWCEKKGLDGVVWTKLSPKAPDGSERIITPEEAVAYVKSLEDRLKNAKRYIEMAPEEIDTPTRRALMKMFEDM
ncbi:MAG: hypothetical protein LVQ95_01925 [Candidatus Micrarchaeales archaeon]|nr:hypothetical protein [Candidatus Micrarchaeales archaeon]